MRDLPSDREPADHPSDPELTGPRRSDSPVSSDRALVGREVRRVPAPSLYIGATPIDNFPWELVRTKGSLQMGGTTP